MSKASSITARPTYSVKVSHSVEVRCARRILKVTLKAAAAAATATTAKK